MLQAVLLLALAVDDIIYYQQETKLHTTFLPLVVYIFFQYNYPRGSQRKKKLHMTGTPQPL
jgi:hypothetical protein